MSSKMMTKNLRNTGIVDSWQYFLPENALECYKEFRFIKRGSMKLRLALEEKLMDVRVRDRLVAEGKIPKEELKKYNDALPDDGKNAIPLDHDDAQKMQ